MKLKAGDRVEMTPEARQNFRRRSYTGTLDRIAKSGRLLIRGDGYKSRDYWHPAHWQKLQTCRVCGCTNDDCRQCIAKTGQPCHWVEDDLCSACAEEEDTKLARAMEAA